MTGVIQRNVDIVMALKKREKSLLCKCFFILE